MIKSNNLDITRIFYNNIDISDLYYNLKKYFKRCICDCSLGGGEDPDDPDLPIDDFGLYINTYNTRELMLDSIYREELGHYGGFYPLIQHKYTALDDCYVYNYILPVSYMNFAEHDGKDSRWFVPLVTGNEEIEYADLYVDHNLVKRYTSLTTGEKSFTDDDSYIHAGNICNFVKDYKKTPTISFGSDAELNDYAYHVSPWYENNIGKAHGIYINYADVANASLYWYELCSIDHPTEDHPTTSDFRSYGYSSNFYRINKYKNNLFSLLYVGYAPIIINVKYKKKYTEAYTLAASAVVENNVSLYKKDNILLLSYYGYEAFFITSFNSMCGSQPVNIINNVGLPKDLLKAGYIEEDVIYFNLQRGVLSYEKIQAMVPPKLNSLKLSLYLMDKREVDLYCLTERPLNISLFVPDTGSNFSGFSGIINIYCKEEWENNYTSTIERLNAQCLSKTNTKDVIFNLKTF